MQRVRDLMLALLRDPQVEVRETAQHAISVLVRIQGEALALQLRDEFAEWAAAPIPKRAKGGVPEDGSAEAMRKRHAGVLGLAALVGAYPYDVPEWMPDVLVQLAGHVLDPSPINQVMSVSNPLECFQHPSSVPSSVPNLHRVFPRVCPTRSRPRPVPDQPGIQTDSI
ncbi:hypothetical protein T484DRAFT_2814179 [Baffinella frigidus]|nr:hypothetical protein T484DRAFT_2814179 [Cryptophyta sp. CCMP2293]